MRTRRREAQQIINRVAARLRCTGDTHDEENRPLTKKRVRAAQETNREAIISTGRARVLGA